MLLTEPLLDPANERFSLYPIKFEDIYEAYVQHRSMFWIPEEVQLHKDHLDWKNELKEDERQFIKKVLAFFASSDVVVNDNIEIDSDDVKVLEYKLYLHDKEAREDIHTIMYHRLLDAFVDDQMEKEYLFSSIVNIPTIKKKIDWFKRYFTQTFAHRKISSAITEGVFFSGSFCAIFWLKKRGLMPGLCTSNEFISREEGLHCDVECMIYKNYVANKLSEETIENMIREAVEIEIEFVNYILPTDLLGINAKYMSDYIMYTANRLSVVLIDKKLYDVELPFEWMHMISQSVHTNFFEHKPAQYAKFEDKEKITITDDF